MEGAGCHGEGTWEHLSLPWAFCGQNGQEHRYLRSSLADGDLIHSQEPLKEGMDVSSSLSGINMSGFKGSKVLSFCTVSSHSFGLEVSLMDRNLHEAKVCSMSPLGSETP